jgi:hypothetical protein
MYRSVILMMLLGCGSLPLLAAAADAPATQQKPQAATDAKPAPPEAKSTAERDAALAEEIRKAEADAASAPKAASNETFVPSEKISEDLSVSFPVDI